MKHFIALAGAAAALLINVSVSQAQCGPCASSKTVAACIECSRKSSKNPGNWTDAGMRQWCESNMPACRKK